LDVDPRYLATPYSYEARAWEAYLTSDWDASLKECRDWLTDEPFSRRAAILGTHVAAGVLSNYDTAVEIATDGLKANPHDQILLNNLAFALASAGKIEDARMAYEQMSPAHLGDEIRACWFATGGLLKFREGLPVEGRALYQQAITLTGNQSNSRLAVTAKIFLAREETLAKTAHSLTSIAEARKAVEAFHGEFPKSLVAALDRVAVLLPVT
jgi:tetratricopeptide (TPR) repeat protein